MRAALVALAIACGLASATAGPRAGFDHAKHEAVACAQCHTLRAGELAGKPGHAACFGCHTGMPPVVVGQRLAIPEKLRPVCLACHGEPQLAAAVSASRKEFAVDYPPYRIAPDLVAGFGHAKHAASACTACHAAPDAKVVTTPHKPCARCHDGKTDQRFAMTACARCHVPGGVPAGMPEAELLVDAAFSHVRHAARGAAGKQCATCHPGVAQSADRVPRPTMASCATAACHDGKGAFAVTSSCTKCHRDPPAKIFAVARPTTRFSHTLAAHAAANQPCITCHPVEKSGELQVAGHEPCVACHADDFAARQPKICGACHNGTEPWRPLVADRRPAEHTELGVTLPHDQHAKLACTSCHSLTTATAQLRPPRGHSACTNAGCHAKSGGPSPQIVQCERCHELGLAERRETTRRAARWSVRARFDHAPHEQRVAGDTGKTPLPCTACHVDMSAKRVLDLAAPPKSTCAPCHDGGAAFKLTGTNCTRCHPGPTK